MQKKMNPDTSDVNPGTPRTEKISTEYLVWAPRKRKETTEARILEKKKLKFDDAEMREVWEKKEGTPVRDPSSPIKHLELGFVKLRTTMAPCKCYIEAVPCGKPQCQCKKRHKKLFDEEKIQGGKKKISLKCTCPMNCEDYYFQSAQEMI